MGRRRVDERRPGGGDLDVLDPITGEVLGTPGATGGAAPVASPGRRWRLASRALAALAVLSLLGAAYVVVTISTVRDLERTWRSAMAVDAARIRFDDEIEHWGRQFDLAADDPPIQRAKDQIGKETADALVPFEQRLRSRWIVDGRTDALRDRMVEALRFRRFQLAPGRRQLGDSPLVRVEWQLADQLDRYHLAPAAAPLVTEPAPPPGLAQLRRYADVRTDTILVAVADGTRLVTLDVDRSRSEQRVLPAPAEALVAAGDLAVVAASGSVTAYPLDPARPPAWSVAGTQPLVARPGRDNLLWVLTPGGIAAVSRDGTVTPPVPIPVPPDATLLADTVRGLLVGAGGQLGFWDPSTGARTGVPSNSGRFVGATPTLVLVQTPGTTQLAVEDLAQRTIEFLALPRTDAGEAVAAPGRDVLAFAAGPLAGNFASVLRLELEPASWRLAGVGGPRVSIERGSMAWAPARDVLFWRSPDGRLAIADGTTATTLRTPLTGVTRVVAFPAGK